MLSYLQCDDDAGRRMSSSERLHYISKQPRLLHLQSHPNNKLRHSSAMTVFPLLYVHLHTRSSFRYCWSHSINARVRVAAAAAAAAAERVLIATSTSEFYFGSRVKIIAHVCALAHAAVCACLHHTVLRMKIVANNVYT